MWCFSKEISRPRCKRACKTLWAYTRGSKGAGSLHHHAMSPYEGESLPFPPTRGSPCLEHSVSFSVTDSVSRGVLWTYPAHTLTKCAISLSPQYRYLVMRRRKALTSSNTIDLHIHSEWSDVTEQGLMH